MPESARFRRPTLALLLSLGIAPWAAACADLRPIASGVCGNEVIDGDEDCDGHTPDGGRCAAPGSPHACRYVCGSVSNCPAGYGCGKDGVCRRAPEPANEQTVPLGDPIPFPSLQALAAADFDANGADEVIVFEDEDALGRRSARVIAASPTGGEAQVATLPVTMTATAVAKLEGDATDDVAFADIGGVTLLHGTRDLRGEIGAYPSILPNAGTELRTVPLEVLPDQSGDELVAFVHGINQTTVLFRPAGVLPLAVLTSVPGPLEQMAGDVAAARFDESLGCAALAFAYAGDSRVFLFWPCRTGKQGLEWSVQGTPVELPLPPGEKVGAGLLAADLDLDGHSDLLIADDEGALLIAWGAGDGTFLSAKENGVKGQAGPFTAPAAAGEKPGLPLAVADLNADGTIDFVFPKAVLVSSGADYTEAVENVGPPWTAAVASDLNANGLVDVAAATKGSLNIDFLNNAGNSGMFNPFVLTTSGGVERLAAGDFDGDLVNDLALSQSLDAGGTPVDELDVAFGSPLGPPGAPVKMAKLDEVEQIYTAHLPLQSGAYGLGGADAVGDLVVTARAVASQTDRTYELRGSGSRVMTAPLSLRAPVGAARPLALSAGIFGDPTPDMVALAADIKTNKLHLFRIESTEEIAYNHIVPSDFLPGDLQSAEPGPIIALRYGAVVAAGDLDASGNAEAVVVAHAGSTADGAAVVIADYDARNFTFHPRPAQPLSLRLGADSQLALRDVDGDGALDAVIVGGSIESPTALTVLWNDGKGGLDTASPARIEVDDGATGAACVPLRRGGCELFITTKSHTYRALSGADRAFSVEVVRDVPGGVGVAAGDFDEDGVLDLAIGQPSECALFRRLPELQ
jgi:hypothetical protein